MEEQRSNDSVLVLTDELLLDIEAGGEDAIESESGVLLLSNELPPEPVIKKIDVSPRISGLNPPEAMNEDEIRAGLAKAWQLPKSRRQDASSAGRDAQSLWAVKTSEPAGAQGTGLTQLSRILYEARAFASEYGVMKARTRKALYEALGRTYDFAILAEEQPEECARLIEDAGLTVLDRAPCSPIVKLVFGADYDKTRVAEFAAAIAYGRRKNLPRGAFTAFLDQSAGGLKAVIGLERLMRKGESDAGERVEAQPALARKLRQIRPSVWDDLSVQGDEFALVLARRLPDGSIAMVGEIPRDIGLLERAARKLLVEHDHASEGPTKRANYHPEGV